MIRSKDTAYQYTVGGGRLSMTATLFTYKHTYVHTYAMIPDTHVHSRTVHTQHTLRVGERNA